MSGNHDFDDLLKGGDLRSIGKANEAVIKVSNQDSFDALFNYLRHNDRKIVMRTADAIEKITRSRPEFLSKHKSELLKMSADAKAIELKWHLAQLIPRLKLTPSETGEVWQLLSRWASDESESRIVRANSVQALFELLQTNRELTQDFKLTVAAIKSEKVASLNARIRKLGLSDFESTEL